MKTICHSLMMVLLGGLLSTQALAETEGAVCKECLKGPMILGQNISDLVKAAEEGSEGPTEYKVSEITKKDIPYEVIQLARKSNIEKCKNDDPVEVIFAIENDSMITTSHDDFGKTHGTELKGRGPVGCQLYLTIGYSTQVYTKMISRELRGDADFNVNQYKVDENLLSFIFDNLAKNKVSYQRFGLAWQRLDEKDRSNILSASSQQRTFHNLIKHENRPRTISTGKRRDGVLMTAAAGLRYQNDFKYASTTVQSEMAVRLGNLKNVSSVANDSSIKVSANKGLRGLSIQGGAQTKLHSKGVEYNPYLEVSLNRPTWLAGVRSTGYYGNVHNYQKYNLPEYDVEAKTFEDNYESTLYFYLGKKFGGPKNLN